MVLSDKQEELALDGFSKRELTRKLWEGLQNWQEAWEWLESTGTPKG